MPAMTSPAVDRAVHRCRRIAGTLLVVGLLAVADGARAGPWRAVNAQGLELRMEHDPTLGRLGYVLRRQYPDGSPDTGFGEQGRTLFSLGPDNEGPAALRLDPLGRPWVAGASAGPGDTLDAVVLRFLVNGQADASWGQAGRSATAPAGRKARALDLAPQADGSCFVVGLVDGADGAERSGWWRLLPNGRIDTRFGLGGLWVDSGAGVTEVMSVSTAADGTVALELRREVDGRSTQERWALGPGQNMPALAAAVDSRPAARGSASAGPARAPLRDPGPASATPSNPDGRAQPVALLPATGIGREPDPRDLVGSPGGGWVGWALASVAPVVGGLWWWRRRRHRS
jgi:uncharacterized delta-60 repeat protein